jgi:hypothetical protein
VCAAHVRGRGQWWGKLSSVPASIVSSLNHLCLSSRVCVCVCVCVRNLKKVIIRQGLCVSSLTSRFKCQHITWVTVYSEEPGKDVRMGPAQGGMYPVEARWEGVGSVGLC